MKAAEVLRRLTAESRTPQEIRDAVYLFGDGAASKQTRFWLLLVLATGIATAGVIADSTATVIGAMIVAPLAIPIQGVAVAIAYGEIGPLLRCAGILLAAIVVVIGLAALLAVVLPELESVKDNTQIAGRVSPTIVDLAAAATTGLAGAFAVGRRDIGDILPGVAIAISLVPPLAVVGVTAVAGDWGGALGALVLFLTNVLAIVVAGTLLFSALRVAHGARPEPAFHGRPVYAVVAVASVVIVAALAVATYRTVQLDDRRDAAQTIASRWARENGERLQLVRYDGDDLVLVVEGMTDGDQDRQLPQLLAGAIPDGTPIVVNRIAGTRQTIGDVGR